MQIGKVFIILIIMISLSACSITEQAMYIKQDIFSGNKLDQYLEMSSQEQLVKEIYITVLPAEKQSARYAHTFTELNDDTNFNDEIDIEVKVLFQEGHSGQTRPGLFGFGLTDANAVMKQRGHAARSSRLKSYRVELEKQGGLWYANEIINLNKHYSDFIRFRNKLSFDLLKTLPNISSVDTNFVHLFIKDLSESNYNNDFIDFGLYTHIEQIDREYLQKRGLDSNGHLYKAENFEFFVYPELLPIDSDLYDEKEFETIMEIKGNDEHSKLINMLHDVNNKFMHINDVIEKHFNKDNYLTWLAVNILFGNTDTNSQNFFLYSPKNEERWYFIPWDFDGAWDYYLQTEKHRRIQAPWQEGISNYWGVVLHRRFFQNDNNIKELAAKIEEIHSLIKDQVPKLIELYKPISFKFLAQEPDNRIHSWTEKQILQEMSKFPQILEKNKEIFYKNIEKPMPNNMGQPINFGNYLILKWDDSYDLQGDYITYSIAISKTPDFQEVIFQQDGIMDTEYIVKGLEPGTYYWKLIISDSKGNKQVPFNRYRDAQRNNFFGIQEFVVNM
ncbi:MAG: CotH kinase family protein [Bacillota bacterium]